jgi:thermitase
MKLKKAGILFLLVTGCTTITTQAQLVKKTVGDQKTADWYNLSADKDQVYGAEINKAYDFLKGKTPKKTPLVAIIGQGLDVEHEDFKDAVWTNKLEKADGIDNDENGWVDDLQGWNFLGNAKGEAFEELSTEGDREYFRLHDKYDGIFFTGTDYLKFDDLLNKPVVVPAPANLAEYKYYRYTLTGKSRLVNASLSFYFTKFMKYYLTNDFDQQVKKLYPDPSKVTYVEFSKIDLTTNNKPDTLKMIAYSLLSTFMGTQAPNTAKGTPYITFDAFKEHYLKTSGKSKENFDALLAKHVDASKIIGNNWADINQKSYGNNNLYSKSAFASTMAAGIISGTRNNGMGINGISNAQILPLRVYPQKGDPYYKDLALAIRYAADQNSDVILLSTPNEVYPAYEAKWVNDALLYAEQKGALVIAPVVDAAQNLSTVSYYPNKHISLQKELNNMITVAASDSIGNPSMNANYGKKELDLFAPGLNVSTAYLGDTYRKGSGSIISAATVAGVAALVKSYYPEIKAPQLRSLILNNVTRREGVEIEKRVIVNGSAVTDLYLFDELCASGGIVNGYKAIVAADELSKKRSK